jgi:hypothetical protein
MKRQSLLAMAVFLMISSLSLVSVADDFDGSQPLVCAAIFSAECNAGEQECITGAPWMINIPVFMKVDFEAKKVTTTKQHENPRTSTISHVGKLTDGHTAIQGVDNAFVWSMLITEETGSMTLSIAGEDTGYLIFGACLPAK